MFDQYLNQLDVVDMYAEGDLLDRVFQNEPNIKTILVEHPTFVINKTIEWDGSYFDRFIKTLSPESQDMLVNFYCELWANRLDGKDIPGIHIDNPYY
jgi:hypothetical protein